MPVRVIGFAVALIFLIFKPIAYGAETPTACSLKRVASLDAITNGGQLLIPVKIEGRDSWVRVDTGAPFSMISKNLAAELKLALRSLPYGEAVDGSGKAISHFVKINKLQLGDMSRSSDTEFLVMGERSSDSVGFDGTFGADFLAAYDVELDLSHSKVNLFLQDHCKGQVVYWTQDFVAIPFELDASLHPVIRVKLDGQDLKAMLDTGTTSSVLSTISARRHFNIDPEGDGTKPDGEVRTATGESLPFYRHRFSVLDIGGVEFHNTEFILSPDRNARDLRQRGKMDVMPDAPKRTESTDIIIGLHHLARLHAYIAYREGLLYVSAADAK